MQPVSSGRAQLGAAASGSLGAHGRMHTAHSSQATTQQPPACRFVHCSSMDRPLLCTKEEKPLPSGSKQEPSPTPVEMATARNQE